MANSLVFLFQQVTVRYPCVTDSESVHDRLLLATECSSCAAQTLLQSAVVVSETTLEL